MPTTPFVPSQTMKTFLHISIIILIGSFSVLAQNPPKPPKPAVVALIAMCTPENTDDARKYILALTDLLRAGLNQDQTISILPASVSDNAVSKLSIPGFVSSLDEVKKAASRLPSECNVLVIIGPFPTGTSPTGYIWFDIPEVNPTTLSGTAFRFSVKSDAPVIEAPNPEDIKKIVRGMRLNITDLLEGK